MSLAQGSKFATTYISSTMWGLLLSVQKYDWAGGKYFCPLDYGKHVPPPVTSCPANKKEDRELGFTVLCDEPFPNQEGATWNQFGAKPKIGTVNLPPYCLDPSSAAQKSKHCTLGLSLPVCLIISSFPTGLVIWTKKSFHHWMHSLTILHPTCLKNGCLSPVLPSQNPSWWLSLQCHGN